MFYTKKSDNLQQKKKIFLLFCALFISCKTIINKDLTRKENYPWQSICLLSQKNGYLHSEKFFLNLENDKYQFKTVFYPDLRCKEEKDYSLTATGTYTLPSQEINPNGPIYHINIKTSDFSKTIYNKNLLDLLNQSSTQKFVLNKPITIEDSISDNKVSLYGSYQEIGNKLYWGRPDSDETKRPLYPNDYIFFR